MRGPAYFDSKGACIYCGASGVKLQDEHVVAYALGGMHVLRKASCRICAKITGQFEQRVARDMWGDARIAYNGPSRRKGERPSQLAMGTDRPLRLPAAEFPAALVFYKMGPAGILQGLPEECDISSLWTFTVVDDDERRQRFIENHPDRKLTIKFRHVPDAFGRTLAKIGYCQVLTALDPSDFRPICLPYIMGRKTNFSYLVGGSLDDQQPEPENGYSLSTATFGTAERLMLVALVRLYANTHAPAYHVVVGDVVGPGAVERVQQKLQSDKGAGSDVARHGSHWFPMKLPLPFWTEE